MKKHKKLIAAIVAAVIVVAALFTSLILTAGGNADVVATRSVESFGKITNLTGVTLKDGSYAIESPDGQAEFIWGGEDCFVGIKTKVAPFVAAGLDAQRLPEYFRVSDGVLTLGAYYVPCGTADNALSAMNNIIKANRGMLGYHSSMGHFNLSDGNGNSFEWAQDASSNDKDIVFALDPEPFISAGLLPEEVEGWQYGQVEMHMDGRKVQKYMLLKAFDLA